MKPSDILMLYDYSCWANARNLRAALQVTPEQFVAKNTSSYGSLRGTMVHTISAELIWFNRLQKASLPYKLPTEIDFSTPQELNHAWAIHEPQVRAYLQSLTDADLQAVLPYQNTKGQPFQNVTWHILAQVLNHGTQHRAEAAAMLTDFGYSPGDIDMIIYLREKGI
jgi:uncharacterized damage-inducible protein DinB